MISTLQLISIITSALLYLGFFQLNEILFSSFAFHIGAHWIFLPAGMRLICTLIFGGEGAVGVLLASLTISSGLLSMDPVSMLITPLISAGAPYLVYRFALSRGMPATLEKLNTKSLLPLIVLCSKTSSLIHSIWYSMRGVAAEFLSGFAAMFIGDLTGSIIVVYAIKFLLAGWERMRTN